MPVAPFVGQVAVIPCMMNIANITPGQLRKAADIKEQIEILNGQLRITLLGSPETSDTQPEEPRRRRRRMSAATKARLAQIARKRWKLAKRLGRHTL